MVKVEDLTHGSSPRMWGTQCHYPCGEGIRRFIPTHVGNTRPHIPKTVGISVHPHACGEHDAGTLLLADLLGSSPRMWGTLQPHNAVHTRIRFIPTHVGNTHCSGSGLTRRSVHPHACGEHSTCFTLSRFASGSSPRMWGTLANKKALQLVQRFIPTHVGNTTRCAPACRARPVHPHACGEHYVQGAMAKL